MKLDVHVSGRTVANLYRERDEYVLKYLPGTDLADFISITMPVREEAWNEGMASLRNPKSSVEFKGLDMAIVKAGFSTPERPENPKTTIGRSELLRAARKR